MQLPNLPLNIKIQLGEEQNQHQQLLGHIRVANFAASQINKLKEKAKYNEDIGDDIVCLFKYSIQPGRQEEARDYFQGAINQTLDASVLSPLQALTQNPHSKGKAEIRTNPGQVVVIYRFFSSEIDDELREYLLNNVSKFNTVEIDVLLKGFVSHSLKNRANVKVNYAKVHITSEKAESSILTSILTDHQIIPPEVIGNPFFSCYGRAKKINLALKFRSFREMNKYYDNLLLITGNNSNKKQEREDFKYTNHGLFREKVEAYLFDGSNFAITGDLTHHGEDAFMRLIKVYYKAAKKGLDL